MNNPKIFQILLAVFLLCPRLLHAAGAYLVDDGGIVDEKTLQIESWYSKSSNGDNIYVVNPAYQLLPNAEFAIQETYTDQRASASTLGATANTLWPQVKYQWYKAENIYSTFTTGVNYSSTKDKVYGAFAYSSNTIKFNEMTFVHLYLGWQNWRHVFENDKSIDFLNYGAGYEIHLTDKFFLTGEVFSANGQMRSGPKQPAAQFGFRYSLVQNILLDVIYGHNINGNQKDWITFGVSLWF